MEAVKGRTKEVSRWYALYTKSRAEKKLCEELEEKRYEVYLPLEKKLKQWSDRKKWVEEPLFKSYLFVKIKKDQRFDVLNTNGAVCFVTFRRELEPIPESQIQTIRDILTSDLPYEVTNENFQEGDLIEIQYGKLKGMQGELIDSYGKKGIAIRINSIQQNIILKIDVAKVKLLKKAENKISSRKTYKV